MPILRPRFPSPDRIAVENFIDALFRYASPDTFISLRAFHDLQDGRPPLFIEGVPVGDPQIVDRVCARIAEAATHPEPHVFCPPVCTFKAADSAKAEALAEGVALTVECDEQPQAALAKLTAILGPPTAVVASGGTWMNPETGKPEAKIHLHWRLAKPASDAEGHALLREARDLAAALVGADRSAVAIVHPLRWPGSWHRKAEPRIARLKLDPEAEIAIEDALARLREASPPTAAPSPAGAKHDGHARTGSKIADDVLDVVAALAVIPNGNLPWDEWNRIGMVTWLASSGSAFTAFDDWSRKSSKYDAKTTADRWAHYSTSPPSRIGAGSLFHMATQADPDWRRGIKDETADDANEDGADDDNKDGTDGGKVKQADVLIALAQNCALFHAPAPDNEAYADIEIKGHRETHRIRGKGFRQWLRHQYFKRTGSGCNSDAMQVAVETIAAKAQFEGEEREVHCRIAEHEGAIYIDIGDQTWRAIEITESGWKVIAEPPVRFRRSPSTQALPIPVVGGSIDLVRPFCNVKSDGEFVLLVAYALAVLRPNAAYPALVITGEQGSAKSTLCRTIQRLTDPRMPEQRTLPRDEDELVTAAKGSHLLCYDNISGMPDWLSDAFCRLSTGGGAGKRKLYTDDDESLFAGRRPVVINGIEDAVTRPDLVDRMIMLTLEHVQESKRRDEKALDAEFERGAPAILGALLNGIVAGLKNLASVSGMEDKPRMADFAVWGEACTRAYWPAGTFLAAYRDNLAASVELAIEASPVGDALRRFMAGRAEWQGTASQLLPLLTTLIGEQAARERGWPKRADGLSGKLRRAAPALRKTGLHVEFHREGHSRTRTLHITTHTKPEQTGKTASAPSAASAGDGKIKKTNGLSAAAADAMRTRAPAGGVRANSLENNEMDTADAADAELPLYSGGRYALSTDPRAMVQVSPEPLRNGRPYVISADPSAMQQYDILGSNGHTVWPRAISSSPEDRREPGPGQVFARVTVSEIRVPAISAGPDDDLNDLIVF